MPKTSLRSLVSLLSCLCLGALLAVGCSTADDGLADAARNISKRTSRLEGKGSARDAADEDEMMGMAGAAAEPVVLDDEDEMAGDDDAAAESAGDSTESDQGAAGAGAVPVPPESPALPVSDDSAHCGDKRLDVDELCDVGIAKGEPGACPTECPQFDECHLGKLEAHGCLSKCVQGEDICG